MEHTPPPIPDRAVRSQFKRVASSSMIDLLLKLFFSTIIGYYISFSIAVPIHFDSYIKLIPPKPCPLLYGTPPSYTKWSQKYGFKPKVCPPRAHFSGTTLITSYWAAGGLFNQDISDIQTRNWAPAG